MEKTKKSGKRPAPVKMSTGEPDKTVKKRIASMYANNRYSALDDASSDGGDGGGGAPLYSPSESSTQESSSGQDTTGISQVKQASPTIPPDNDNNGDDAGGLFADQDQPSHSPETEVASGNGDSSTPKGGHSRAVSDDEEPSSRLAKKRRTDLDGDEQSGWRGSNTNVHSAPLANFYGHYGGNGGIPGPAGMTVHVGLPPPLPYPMSQYAQGYTHYAADGGNPPGPMPAYSQYPQYIPGSSSFLSQQNTGIPPQPIPSSHSSSGFPSQGTPSHHDNGFPQQSIELAGPFPWPYQSPGNQGRVAHGSFSSPISATSGYKSETTPTPGQRGTPGGLHLGSPLAVTTYNKTEPRNFAPRTRAGSIPAPPQFGLGGMSSPGGPTRSAASQLEDPFLESPPKIERAAIAVSSRALLPSLMESDESIQVSAEVRAMRSPELNALTSGPNALPTIEAALNPVNFPFIETCTQSEPVAYGVVKIKNIPFATKRAEIIAFLGRNSKILNDTLEPVHIIMERVSSKTLDAYVEFMTFDDAVKAVDRHNKSVGRGRLSRLGDRPVEMVLSSQSQLMNDLFPLASGVMWDGSNPQIQAPIAGQPWKDFKGFVTEEEMTMLVKHVEIPHRSPYSKDCPQRPYECMISTLKKIPWYKSDCITIRQRFAVFRATYRLLELLKEATGRQQTPVQESVLNEQLQKRLLQAAMLCPGFSVLQKDNFAYLMNLTDPIQRGFNQPRFPELWVHEQAICPRPGCPIDVLEWYIAIIREETQRHVSRFPINQRNAIEAESREVNKNYFGSLWHEIDYPQGLAFDGMSLHAAAALELSAIERVLKRALSKD